MENQSKTIRRVSVKKTDRRVKNCENCDDKSKCTLCDKTFGRRESTSFHQIKKDLISYRKDKAKMIVDLGCPNSVLGVSDVELFESSLSEFQQENLKLISADDKFKFGPSGQYNCSKKLSFPIGTEKEPLWVNIAIVDAKIPMLLGNNILKPFEAEIKLFSTGHGVLVLEEEEFELEETESGYYVVAVIDLRKLCRMRSY